MTITPPPPPPEPAVPGALIDALIVFASQEIYLALRITTPPPAPEAPPAPPLKNKGVGKMNYLETKFSSLRTNS